MSVLGQVAHDDANLIRITGNPLSNLDQAFSEVLFVDLRERREEPEDLLVHHCVLDHFIVHSSFNADLIAHRGFLPLVSASQPEVVSRAGRGRVAPRGRSRRWRASCAIDRACVPKFRLPPRLPSPPDIGSAIRAGAGASAGIAWWE